MKRRTQDTVAFGVRFPTELAAAVDAAAERADMYRSQWLAEAAARALAAETAA